MGQHSPVKVTPRPVAGPSGDRPELADAGVGDVKEDQETDSDHQETDRRGRDAEEHGADDQINRGEGDGTEGVEEVRHGTSDETRGPRKGGFRSNGD